MVAVIGYDEQVPLIIAKDNKWPIYIPFMWC
jgi:hypothetical protein